MNAPLKRQPLPDSWVERIFDRMQGLYGSLWLDRWRSGEVLEQGGQRFDRGLLLAKATWADELSGFADQPARIAQALDACRSLKFPPTVPEFLALCRETYPDRVTALPAPDVPPAVIAARQAEAEEMAKQVAAPRVDHKAWAKGLRAEFLAGRNLGMQQQVMASAALGEHWTAENGKRECSPIYDAEAA